MKTLLVACLIYIGIYTANAQCWQDVTTGNAGNYSMAIKPTGNLFAFGENTDGRLGDNTTTNRPDPTAIGSATNWKIIAPNGNHTSAVTTNGELWGWGNNGGGALGDGTYTNRLAPTRIGTETNWDTVASGASFTHAIKTNGTLWAWGDGGYNQLGTGSINHNSPTQIGTETNWKSVSGGVFSTVALKTDGTLWQWGNGYYPGAPSGTPVKIGTANDWKWVVHGAEHNLALKNDGSLWVWGNNLSGQLGDGTSGNSYSGLPKRLGTENDWAFISAGGSASFAIKTNGTLWAWGSNSYGQLGDGSNTDRLVPTQIGTATDWKKVAAGATHTLALKNDGNIWASGSNSQGELGIGSNINTNTFTLVGCMPLPVNFGSIQVSVHENILTIKWETLHEINNDHFDIEISNDGKIFEKAATIKSKYSEGNSSNVTEYLTQVDLEQNKVLFIVLPLFFLLFSVFYRRKPAFNIFFFSLLILTITGLSSCKKSATKDFLENGQKIFVRIAQVDKDGTTKFSRIIKVAKE